MIELAKLTWSEGEGLTMWFGEIPEIYPDSTLEDARLMAESRGFIQSEEDAGSLTWIKPIEDDSDPNIRRPK